MAKTLSATSVAIAQALTLGTLVVSEHFNARLGVAYVAISDERGLIEVALDRAAADARIAEIAARLAA